MLHFHRDWYIEVPSESGYYHLRTSSFQVDDAVLYTVTGCYLT